MKPLIWEDTISVEEGIIKSEAEERYEDKCEYVPPVYCRYVVTKSTITDAYGMEHLSWLVTVKFSNKYVNKAVYSLEEGKLTCQLMRLEFWMGLKNLAVQAMSDAE